MSDKIIFQNRGKKELFEYIKRNKNRHILNFLNQHDIYQFNNEKLFRRVILRKENMNFIDGAVISAFLSFFNLKHITRVRGPEFARNFMIDNKMWADKRHFFIGFNEADMDILKKLYPHLKNIEYYNPPYIKNLSFSNSEVKKIADMINKYDSDIVWVGIGCPKQNILSDKLFDKTKTQYFFNVGAALDFLIGKKKEAPAFARAIGMEWLFRLITDFRYTKTKVMRSFVALFYLGRSVKLAEN